MAFPDIPMGNPPRYGFHFVDAVDPRCRGALGIGENGGFPPWNPNESRGFLLELILFRFYVGFSGSMDPKFETVLFLFVFVMDPWL